MKYVQKNIPEGINVSKGHPLKDLLKLSLVILGAITLLYISLGALADSLTHQITYQQEINYFQNIIRLKRKKSKESLKLSKLTNKLWSYYPDSKDIKILVQTIDEPTPNAFMTLGGRLIVTQGIINEMKYENEVAFVLCHEIGHFYERHVLKSMGRQLLISLAMSMLGLAEKNLVLDSASNFSHLSFSRVQEKNADFFAVDCMNNHYDHVNGYSRFFKMAQSKYDNVLSSSKILSYASTHPINQERLDYLKKYIEQKGYSTQGKLLPYETKKSQHEAGF